MEKNYIVTDEQLSNAQPAQLQWPRDVVAPYGDALITFWWIVFFLTSLVVIVLFLRRISEVYFQHHQ